MQELLESIESELYQISKNESHIECVSCKDLIKSDTEEFDYVCDDAYCLACLQDGDLLAYRYN
jgi:hypothetical protein